MFSRFSEHVYYRLPQHYSDRPTIGFIKGAESSLLFEAGSSEKHALEIKNELKEEKLGLPEYVALSHWHWDHSFGLFAWDATTIAGKDTNRHLRKLSSLDWSRQAIADRVKRRKEINFCYEMMMREYEGRTEEIKVVPADLEFNSELTIDLGGVRAVLMKIGGPHSLDSVVCYIPEDRFLFLGDSNGKNLYLLDWEFDINKEDKLVETLASLPYDEDQLEEYKEKLKALDFDTCISGHSDIMTKEELLASLEE